MMKLNRGLSVWQKKNKGTFSQIMTKPNQTKPREIHNLKLRNIIIVVVISLKDTFYHHEYNYSWEESQ